MSTEWLVGRIWWRWYSGLRTHTDHCLNLDGYPAVSTWCVLNVVSRRGWGGWEEGAGSVQRGRDYHDSEGKWRREGNCVFKDGCWSSVKPKFVFGTTKSIRTRVGYVNEAMVSVVFDGYDRKATMTRILVELSVDYRLTTFILWKIFGSFVRLCFRSQR